MKRINIEALIQLILLWGMAALLCIALLTGKARYYVHPRLDGYLWFAVVALAAVGAYVLPGLTRPRHRPSLLPYALLAFPLLTAFVFPPAVIGGGSVTLGGGALASRSPQATPPAIESPAAYEEPLSLAPIPSTGLAEDAADWYAARDSQPAADESETPVPSSGTGIPTITDDQYAEWFMDVYRNTESYIGTTVRVKGSIFRREDFTAQEFVPSRMLMVCCAADVEPLGFLARYNDLASWQDGDWVWVTATIYEETYQDELMPVLEVLSLEAADPPGDEYIYF